MTKRPRFFLHPLLQVVLLLFGLCPVPAQQPAGNTSQQLVFAGLRTLAAQGQINAVETDGAGNIYILLDEKDGVRVLKLDSAAGAILAQAQLGAKGDIGVALALDPAGNVFVAGTTSSAKLAATPEAAIPAPTDNSTQSFVAKLDANLNARFVTFTGGSKIAASAVAATADAVFVTGITYATNLPVTADGIQQTPALGSAQNGFVEKFSSSGATLLYATYLTGALGDTTPTAIVADTADNAYITGSTSASGFPTVAALVPAMLSNPSGFLTRLSPAGDAITFSTFIPGAGLSSLAFDSMGSNLLLSGSVALGQFPIDNVSTPLVPTTYQVLLRIPLNGGGVLNATVIAPGQQSFVAAAPNGAAWVDGTLTYPLLPLAPLSSVGTGFAVRVDGANVIDQTARFGGVPNANPTFASLPTTITSVAVDGSGEPIIAGTVQPTASSSLLASETYDLPLRPTAALPSTIRAAELTAATCNGSLCAGSAAYLAKLNPNASGPALALSMDDLPFVVVRNLGTAPATSLQLNASGATLTTDCPANLAPGGECNALLAGGGPGTLTASAPGDSQSVAFPVFSSAPPLATIAFHPKELDFGIQTSASAASTRTITITNLGASSQTFNSALNNAFGPASPFTEVSSDCTLGATSTSKLLGPGGTCHITIGVTASATATNDGFVRGFWSIGARSVLLIGYSQAAALSVSASEIDFGTRYIDGIQLPRYLYLSNNSAAPLSHAALGLPTGSAFMLTDACPSVLLPASVCRVRIDYLAAKTTSSDSVTLAVDGGLSVLLSGQTLPPRGVTGSTVNPNLSVTPASVTFANSTVVTTSSSSTETVTVTNTGTSTFPLTLALTGDYTQATNCGATLAGGQFCSVVLSFAPSQPGVRDGLLAVIAGAGTSPAYVALTGTGSAILPSNNGTLDAGVVPVGQPGFTFYKVAQPFNSLTVSTTGPYSVVLVEDVGFGHGQPPTSAYATTLTGSCHNCFLAIEFKPGAAGPQPGSVTIASSATGSPYVLAITGTGLATAGLQLAPATQDFGSVPVHSTGAAVLFTLTNVAQAGISVVVTTPVVTGDFQLITSPTGGQPCGGTLAYSASCFVQVAFAPTATGSRTGTLTLASAGATVKAALTGTGASDPGVALNPLALTFANIPDPSANIQTVTLTNTSAFTLAVGTPSTTLANFRVSTACASVAPGASCTIAVMFVPGAANVADTLAIPVTPNIAAASPQVATYTVALNGTFTAGSAGLQITPNQVSFGPDPVGIQSAPRQFTVTNATGRSLSLALNLPRQFVLTETPCATLAPTASCTFALAFLPLTNGDIPGTIYAQATPADGSPTLSSIAYVEGFGTGASALTLGGGLIVNNVFNFGQVPSGSPATQVFRLTNAGVTPITVRRVTSQPPFLSTTTCGTALASGQSCAVTVTYAPTNQVAGGTVSPGITNDAGLLTIESDAANSPQLVNLTGQGGPIAVTSPANGNPLATYTLSDSSLLFASTTVGSASVPQRITFANTGTAMLHITALTSTPDFSVATTCAAVVPGATCTLTLSATPQLTGARTGALEIASDASTSLEFISLLTTGSPGVLSLSPMSLTFAPLAVGTSEILPLQVTNTGANPVTSTSIGTTGDFAVTGTCPAPGATLAAGASCTLQVTFTPTSGGTRSGILSLGTSASALPLQVPLTGTGTQTHLLNTPPSLNFGNVNLGTSANLSLTVANTGSTVITNLMLAPSSEYTVTQPCPLTTLIAGASCAVQVTFIPAAAGSRPGTLTITSSDSGSPASVALSGTGVQAGGFALTVDGGPSSAVSVKSGQPATYHLTVTPTGYSGTILLTCTPVVAAQYASCSILPSSLTLGGSPVSSIATINTITSTGGNAQLRLPRSARTAFFCVLFPGLFACIKLRRSPRLPRLLALVLAGFIIVASGCGSPAPTNPTEYTPPGSYHYTVTASSVGTAPVSQTVTLNLTVTPR